MNRAVWDKHLKLHIFPTVQLNNPSDPNCPKFKDVYLALIDQLQPRWYDVFLHLGIEREILDKCLKDHPFDYHSSLVKILTVWLQRENPPPSWQALVDVLQNKLLEGKLAVTIKQKFCPELLVENDGNYLYMCIQDV